MRRASTNVSVGRRRQYNFASAHATSQDGEALRESVVKSNAVLYTFIMRTPKQIISVLIVAASSCAMADIHIGGAVGRSNVDTKCKGPAVACSNSPAYMRLTAGYEIYEGVYAEVSYVDAGSVRANFTSANTLVSASFDGLQTGLGYRFAVNDRVRLFARVGMSRLKYRMQVTVPDGVIARSDSVDQVYYGAGVDIAVSDRFTLQPNYEFTSAGSDGTNIGAFSLGLKYNF